MYAMKCLTVDFSVIYADRKSSHLFAMESMMRRFKRKLKQNNVNISLVLEQFTQILLFEMFIMTVVI